MKQKIKKIMKCLGCGKMMKNGSVIGLCNYCQKKVWWEKNYRGKKPKEKMKYKKIEIKDAQWVKKHLNTYSTCE